MKLILLLLSMPLFVSCALFFGDTTREVHIDSEPHGANIYVNGVLYAKTPGKILLPNANYSAQKIIVAKPGYESGAIWVTTKFQKVGYFNILFPPAFLIDFSSGTIFKLNPNDLNQNIILKESQTVLRKKSIIKKN